MRGEEAARPGVRALTSAGLLIAAAGLLLFFLFLLAIEGGGSAPLDRGAMRTAREAAEAGAEPLARIVTAFGSLPAAATVMIVGVAVLAAERRPGAALACGAGFLALVVAVHVIKLGVGRPRPEGTSALVTTASFPSGHAAYSTAYTALAAALVSARRDGARRYLAPLAAAVAITLPVGLTRLVLGVHYLSDVVAGWSLGAAIFGLSAAAAVAVARMRHTGRRLPAGSLGGGQAPP